ncbi:MAG: hypothetical protein ACYTF3_04925 [Planctomycetota bacterium]|jgi:hypothetical protein
MLLSLIHVFAITSGPVAEAAAASVPQPVAPQAQSQAAVGSPPSLLLVLPTSGSETDPVILVGTDFGAGALPFFGLIPSVPLYSFNSPDLPGIGSFSLMVTVVPFTFFPGTVDLTVVSGLQVSNPVDFTIL